MLHQHPYQRLRRHRSPRVQLVPPTPAAATVLIAMGFVILLLVLLALGMFVRMRSIQGGAASPRNVDSFANPMYDDAGLAARWSSHRDSPPTLRPPRRRDMRRCNLLWHRPQTHRDTSMSPPRQQPSRPTPPQCRGTPPSDLFTIPLPGKRSSPWRQMMPTMMMGLKQFCECPSLCVHSDSCACTRRTGKDMISANPPFPRRKKQPCAVDHAGSRGGGGLARLFKASSSILAYIYYDHCSGIIALSWIGV